MGFRLRWSEILGRADLSEDLRDLLERELAGLPYSLGLDCRTIMDAVPFPMVLLDRDLTFVWANEAAARVVGLPIDEFLGRSVLDFVPGDEAEAMLKHLMESGQSLRFSSYPYTSPYHADAEPWYWDGWLQPLRPEEGSEATALFACCLDVTDRVRAQEELESSQRLLQEAEGVARLGGYRYDVATRATYCSAGFYELMGRDPSLPPPTVEEYMEFVHPDDRASLWSTIAEAVQQRQPFSLEFRLRRPDGTWRWIECVGTTRGQWEGRAREVVGACMDITERKASEEACDRSRAQQQHLARLESLSVLAGGIAHDFNNLLQGVLGNAELALSLLPRGSEVERLLREMESAAERAAELSNLMLLYSGSRAFVTRSFDLRTVAQSAYQELDRRLNKNANLRLDLPSTPIAVRGDPTQTAQLIQQLLKNGIEALGHSGGTVVLEAGIAHFEASVLDRCYLLEYELAAGDYAYLRVRDDGEGIHEGELPRIFDPFYSTRFPGRGLGLPAVLGIVRAHRGGIMVESKRSEGTAVTVLLPLDEASEASWTTNHEDDSLPEWRGSGVVMLVDDEHVVRSVGEAVLRYLGFEPLIASSGQEALDLVDGRGGDLRAVILDLSMPGMSGHETLRALRARHPDLPVILSSGYSQAEAAAALHGLRMDGFLHKPYRPSDMREALRAILGE